MKNKLFTIISIFLGVASCIYAVVLVYSGNIEVAGKYSPDGRDFNTILLSSLIGISFLLYGFFNWYIGKPKNNDKN